MAEPDSLGSTSTGTGGIISLKSAVYVAGTMCFILCVVYLIFVVEENWTAVVSARWDQNFTRWLPIVFGGYAASLITTALAWPAILSRLGHHLPTLLAVRLGLLAQVGKYLPGNIGHFLGRAALAKRQNIDFSISGLSTIVEFGSAVIAAFLVAAIGLAFSPEIRISLDALLPGPVFRNIVIVALAVLAIGAIAAVRGSRHAVVSRLLMPALWIAPVCWLACSFVLAGISFHALGSAMSSVPEMSVLTATAIYAAAWAAGFLIPGAPAGLGVREAVLLGFLTPLIGPANAVLLTLSHRSITAITDGTVASAAAFSYFLGSKRYGSSSN